MELKKVAQEFICGRESRVRVFGSVSVFMLSLIIRNTHSKTKHKHSLHAPLPENLYWPHQLIIAGSSPAF